MQYTYILPEHHVALESSLRNHLMGLTPQVMAKLYKVALANVDGPVYENGQFTSHLNVSGISIGTATDVKTGVFIQLARTDENPRLLLTIGAKWAIEQVNPTQGNIATTLW